MKKIMGLMTALIMMTAPGSPGQTVAPFDTAESDLKISFSPSAVQGKGLAAACADFGARLYRELEKDTNVFISPFSISLALAMAYAGARGETAEEMKRSLHFDLEDETLHEAFHYLDGHFKKMSSRKPFVLNIVNAAWGRTDEHFEKSYLDLLARHYGADIRRLDFANHPEPSRKKINAWVERETHGRIQNLLPPGSIDDTERFVLTNAAYFLGDWLSEFPAHATRKAPFHLMVGGYVMADTMFQMSSFNYHADPGGLYQAVSLPYRNSPISMMIILPAKGKLAEVEALLGGSFISDIKNAMARRRMELHMPKFGFESSFSLAGILSHLGMHRAFSGDADFSGMTGNKDLMLSDVLHKTFVKVDEKGTEAAAATAVAMEPTSALTDRPFVFRVDRPFVFLIRDDVTGVLLFAGRCADPTK